MKFIWKCIKTIITILCLVVVVGMIYIAGPSILRGETGQYFENFLSSFEKQMLNLVPLNQYPDYPTGCESVALTMLLQYYDVYVTPDDVIANLPQGQKPYNEDGELYGADPEVEFVGSPYDKDSFGVYNGPIADTAELFRSGAIAKNKASIKEISEILTSGNPVMAWYTSHEDQDFSYDMKWYTEDGSKLIEWPSGEHAVVICGEDFLNFYYADPYTGTIKKADKLTFRKFFNKLGGRIVYYEY